MGSNVVNAKLELLVVDVAVEHGFLLRDDCYCCGSLKKVEER